MSIDAPRRPSDRAHVVIVAAAGYGKTTALEDLAGDAASYHRAPDIARRLAGGPVLPPEPHLLVDDLEQLSGDDQQRLVSTLAALPGVRVTLASRRPLETRSRAYLHGVVYERGAADLALTVDAVDAVLADEHDVRDAALAARVHDVTAGWPVLVHLLADDLGRRTSRTDAALEALVPAVSAWVREHVLAGLPPDAGRTLDLLAGLGPVEQPLAAELGADLASFDWLRQVGIVVPATAWGYPASAVSRVVPLVASVVAADRRLDAVEDRARLRAAARWYRDNGHPLPAARALHGAGDLAGCDALLVEHDRRILGGGGAADVVHLVGTRQSTGADPALLRVLADARRLSGDVAGARRAYAPLMAADSQAGRRDPALAWRMAMVHYSRGDYRAALTVLDAASLTGPPVERDEIDLESCRASVLSMLGLDQEAGSIARRAVAAAEALADDATLATAHLAAANAGSGVRAEAHLAQSLAAAERAGDVVTATRALVNQAHLLLSAARYREAAEVATRAVRSAEGGSPVGRLVVALDNLGQALTRLGRYEEAVRQFERLLAEANRRGLERAAFGLVGLAELRNLQGRREESRSAFLQAAEIARGSGEAQVLVRVLAGLARLLAEEPADLPAARSAASEALALAPEDLRAKALVGDGWVAVAEGDPGLAGSRAEAAIGVARANGAVDDLADALELLAAAGPAAPTARRHLDEALAIWSAAGAEPSADRVMVLLGRLPGADGAARSAAREAARRLLRRGVGTVAGRPLLATSEVTDAVDVRVLGRFEVRIGGQAVPVPAWKSRQARTLVKILVSRRGRHVTRSELCEMLWPDDDPSRTAHRLSVLLSVVRGVLDPLRAWPPDHFVTADLSGLSLDLSHVSVDVERLLQDAAQATSLVRDGAVDRAREILTEVDAAYRGDAFEDDPYDDWAVGLREEARAAWMRSLRSLAALGGSSVDHEEDNGALLVRLLAADPYDAATHAAFVGGLVRKGRHGEARRAFDRWARAMADVDALPPDRRVLETASTMTRR